MQNPEGSSNISAKDPKVIKLTFFPSSYPLSLAPSPLRRATAIKERRRRQLRTCDKDAFGVPLPNTARPFSLFASPFSVAEVCTGLGVYLASLQATVLLALLLSIAMIYPLVDNLNSQRWAEEYTLYMGVSLT